MKHYELVEFLSNLNVKPPCANVKPPRTNVKPPYGRLSGDGSAAQSTSDMLPKHRTSEQSLKTLNLVLAPGRGNTGTRTAVCADTCFCCALLAITLQKLLLRHIHT